MEKNIYYINNLLGLHENFISDVCPQKLINKTANDIPHIVMEGSLNHTVPSWDCCFFNFTNEIRSIPVLKVSNRTNTNDINLFSDALFVEYDHTFSLVAKRILEHTLAEYPHIAIMKNLSFGDICILFPHKLYDYDSIKDIVINILRSFSNGYHSFVLDTPKEFINEQRNAIIERLQNNYLFKRNPNYEEYKKLLSDLLELDVGNNDRKMYILTLCALLLRSILDETAVRWVYESGDLKFESFEVDLDLSRAYKLRLSSYYKFIDQAKYNNPNSDQIWSIFIITKTLLSSFVGRNEIDACESQIEIEDHNNFFGFVPYFSQEYREVTSYYPSHLSPDYCYGFLSIPSTCRFSLWSYFPAYIHEFFHYIPPKVRRERNEKILYLSVYSVLIPLLQELTETNKDKYEYIVRIATIIIDKYRKELIDIRNDKVIQTKNNHSNCSQKYERVSVDVDTNKVEAFRDTMKYNAILHDLIPLLPFNKIYQESIDAYKFENPLDTMDMQSLTNDEIMKECEQRWNEDMTSYIATFSFAMREIRSDLSMCVLLDITLKEYIELLANEPEFAHNNASWVADSTVLRFGFMTRLLYTKELFFARKNDIAANSWNNVSWNLLCKKILTTKMGPLHFENNTLESWHTKCINIIKQIEPQIALEDFQNHQNHLIEYLSAYMDITCSSIPPEHIIHSVFEKSLCSDLYFSLYKPEIKNSLICTWGDDLTKYCKYSFANQLRMLYKNYANLNTNLDRYVFEHKSRLLFRDFLLSFPDIDLERNI